ncbi:WD repeat-containing protein 76 isoform X3 [Dendrobates tinctorius]|uniref:WD repeat-containing protein 76 isoform X3 n=1 Tax=Dendrobates tinctorius TaxID=92724 RepID=UPI003CC9550F
MAPYKKRQLDLKPKHGSSTVKKACPSLVSDCAMKVPVVVLHKLNVEPYQGNRKRNIKEPDHRARSEQDRQEDLVAVDKLTKPPHLGYYSLPPTDEMAPYKKQQLDLKPKHGSSTVKKACPSLVSDCAMKVPVVVLHKLNVEPDQGIRKRNIKEPDHRARSEQDRQEDLVAGDKLTKPPHLGYYSLPPTDEMAPYKKQLDLKPKHGSSTVKKACPSLVSDCAMKVPVVVLHKLNVEPDQGIRKRNIKEPDHRARSEQDRQEVPALGNGHGHDKMVLSPVEQSALLHPTPEFTRNNDQQDCNQKAVCRKQLRVQLVRMNIETKNELEKQATNESDSDHEDVQPTDRSLLNVQHEDQEELSSEKSDSDQFNEQDLEMLSLYERQRLKNIKQNATFLKAIKLHEVSSDLYQLKKNRTIVRREKPQIHTVTRQSNRLQGIAPSLPMAEEQSQFIQKKFPKPSSYEYRNSASYVNDLMSMTTDKQTIARVVPSYVCCLAIHPSNTSTLVAGGDMRGVIGLWDMQSAGVYRFPLLHSRVCSIGFSPSNAERLLSAGREGTIRCGDISRSVFDEVYRGEESLSSFDFLSADGSVLIVSHFDSKLSVVDCRTPPNTHNVRGFLHLNYVRTVNVHPLARDFSLVAEDRSSLIYDVRKLSTSSTQPVMHLFGHERDVCSASFSPSTGNHVLTNDAENVIRFKEDASHFRIPASWDRKQENCFGQGIKIDHKINIFHVNGQLLHTFSCTPLTSQPSACAFHPTRDLMVAGTATGQVCVWKKI